MLTDLKMDDSGESRCLPLACIKKNHKEKKGDYYGA